MAMQEQQQQNSSTLTSTDPNEALRTPQVQGSACGSTTIFQCAPSSSSASPLYHDHTVPMYIDPSRPPQSLSDVEALHRYRRSLEQPSASSQRQGTLTACLEGGSSSSSHLTNSSPPIHPPNPLPGFMPSVPRPPFANTAHRREGRERRDGKGGETEMREDPVFTNDPWQGGNGESSRGVHESAEVREQQNTQAWGNYRSPVNTGTQHIPHPDHAHASDPLNFGRPFAPIPYAELSSNFNPPQPVPNPAQHPQQQQWTQSCIQQPWEEGSVGREGEGKGCGNMQEHAQRLQERWLQEQAIAQLQQPTAREQPSFHETPYQVHVPASFVQPHVASNSFAQPHVSFNSFAQPHVAQNASQCFAAQSYAARMSSFPWVPSSMNANTSEFLPEGMTGPSLPFSPSPFPGSRTPTSHLLGPLLPNFRTPVQDYSRVDAFKPDRQTYESHGFGSLPGPNPAHSSCSQNFHALGSSDRPFTLSDLFTTEMLPGLHAAGVGGWGAGGDDTFHSPVETMQQGPYACSPPPPPPPPPPPGFGGPSMFGTMEYPIPLHPFRCQQNVPTFSAQGPTVQPSAGEGSHEPLRPPTHDFGGHRPPWPPRPPPHPDWGAGGPAPPPPPGWGPPPGGGAGGPPQPPPVFPVPCWGYGGAPMGPQPRPPQKRWLPPPAWTPGIAGGLSYRAWLWTLAGWTKLTSMAYEDRGVAVALSLGGRAGRIAQGMSQAELSQVDGLHRLLVRIEGDLGAEMQDRVRTAAKEFRRFSRPKGMAASEFIVEFERRYQEAHAHGLEMSVTLLTIALLEQAQLSTTNEDWILQCVAGDLTQYDAIRRAMRRCPNLDHRHTDASAWPVRYEEQEEDFLPQWADPQSHSSQRIPRPFYDGGLNVPPSEPASSSAAVMRGQPFSENQADFFPVYSEDSDSDDDYVSSCPSNEEPETQEALVSAFAVVQHRKFASRKTQGTKHFRRGFKRPQSTWAADVSRNSSDTIPPGWDPKRWLARSKCPGCGSRWHRDCKGAGKTFAVFRRKGGKKGGKQGKGFSQTGGKGLNPFAKGGNSFGIFMTTCAAMLASAQAFFPVYQSNSIQSPCFHDNMTCQPCSFESQEQPEHVWSQLFSEINATSNVADMSNCFLKGPPETTVVSPPYEETFSFTALPAQIDCLNTAFPAFQLQDYLNHTDCQIVGLEPFDADWRKLNFAAFSPTARMRFALLLDTGAPQSAAGEDWLNRFVSTYNMQNQIETIPYVTKLSGIGSGSATVRMKKIVPTGMFDVNGSLFLGRWEAQQLEGIGKQVPPLCGLESMFKRQMVISMMNPASPRLTCNAGSQRSEFELITHSGHLLLPIDWGGQPLPSEERYISDPLGLHVWFGNDDVTEPNTDVHEQPVFVFEPPEFDITYNCEPYPYPNPYEPFPDPSTMPPQTSTSIKRQTFTTSTITAPTTTNLSQTREPDLFATVRASADPFLSELPPGEPTNQSQQRQQTTHDSSSKEKRPEAQTRTTKQIKTFPIANESTITENKTTASNIVGATYAMLKQIRLSTKQQQRLAKSATYQRKYKPLPPLSPVPSLSNITDGKWDLWEWWAGSGNMTSHARRTCRLVTGPPITRSEGWELSLPHHQMALLHLLEVHEPAILFAGPTCAPWSQACTTMDEELKLIIRSTEEHVFSFYADACRIQHKHGRFYLYEQPRNSALLKTATAVKLATDTESIDQYLCMCMHDLKSPTSGLPHMKPSVLRGTVLLTNRTCQWCDGGHVHEQLNGRSPGGGLRTSYAQEYTATFCKRCCRDMRKFLHNDETYHAFPAAEDSEHAFNDPYQLEGEVETSKKLPLPVPVPLLDKPRLMPTAKRAPQSAATRNTPASSSNAAPFQQLTDEWDKELEEAVEAGTEAANRLEIEDPRQPLRVKRPEPVTDLLPADAVLSNIDAPDMIVRKNIPVPSDTEKSLNDLRQVYSQRLSAGVTATIQAGPKMRLLQELFGTPFGIQILAAVVAKKPGSTIAPEPLISRVDAPLLKEVYQQKDKDKWLQTSWMKYSTTFYAKKPLWVINLYGIKKDTDPVMINPFQELADMSQDALLPLRSLPTFLKSIVEGTNESRAALLLGLHKRLYHRQSKELKKMLHQAGVPLYILAFVDDAVASCETCRAFAKTAAKPLAKLSTASHFNDTVYFDLIFFDTVILFIGVDESIRFMVLAVVNYKGYDSLESAFRRHWVSHFGPPRKFRSDRESVFNSDKFGVYLASIGTAIEMITAGDQHTWLGLLDRRVQLVRKMYPKLMRDLSEEHLCVEHEDVAAECMIAINTQMTHGGTCPYVMLYGTLPAPLFPEDSEFLVPITAHTIFFEHQLVRTKAIASFHAAMIDERIERTLAGRSRTVIQQQYVPGQHIDFYRRSEKKQLEGWRGPAVILSLLGEGYVTLRWQSHSLDIPISNIRPHLHVKPIVALPPAIPVPAIINAADEPGGANAPLALAAWEQYYFAEGVDHIQDDSFLSLVSCASLMPINSSAIHGIVLRNKVVIPSMSAERDSGVLYNLGKEAARLRAIPNFVGVVLVSGKRFAIQQSGVKLYHASWWIGEATTAVLHQATVTHMVDFVNLGVTLQELSLLRAIVLLEGEPTTGPPLHELLKLHEPELITSEGRLRIAEEEIPVQTALGTGARTGQERISPEEELVTVDNDLLGTTRVASVVDDIQLSASELFAINLRGISVAEYQNEAFITQRHVNSFREYLPDKPFDEMIYAACIAATSSRDTGLDKCSECVFYFDAETLEQVYFPLDKDCRPLNSSELESESAEVTAAQLKELVSWLAHQTGKPARKTDYESRTGLKALPSRWVIEFKRKEGRKIIKCRLCLKGFAESNQQSLNTSSPTATRLGHRVVAQTSATQSWPLESLDVSTAFLQGFRFDELPPGVQRQPCAFVPPAGTFTLLAQLDPVWLPAAEHPEQYVFELQRTAYGLKDAPLMWYIAINLYLQSIGLRNTSHDPCCYKKIKGDCLEILLSLHVDDTLCTGQTASLTWLHLELERRFGTVKREVNRFRHFGVDTFKCLKTHHVYLDQRDYLLQLKPILVNRKRGDGRTADTPTNAEEITLFRSLVSAIAWLGVTFPPALAGASLFQSYLPIPTVGQLQQLNNLLAQFNACYQPLIIRSDILNPVLLVVADSSLGNVAKYSQGGYFILLASQDGAGLCGHCSILSYRSSKSKRVAASTLHAETLAMVSGVEEGSLIQTFLLECDRPTLSTLELLNADPSELIGMIGVTDCHDLLDTLCKGTMPVLSNKAMQLYTTVLREYRESGRVTNWAWVDTRDNLANGLTKLESDGTLPLTEICETLATAAWEPSHPYRWGLQLCEATPHAFAPLPAPPPITKVAILPEDKSYTTEHPVTFAVVHPAAIHEARMHVYSHPFVAEC